MNEQPKGQLRKEIGFAVAMSLVIGTVIGSGIFMKPGKVIASAGGSTMALWAWVLGGIITLAGGLTIAEVGTQIPKTGGLYVYLEEVYGKLWGYLCGWVQTIIYGPAIIGALGLYFGSLLAHLFGLEDWKKAIGIIAVVFLATINSLGTKYGGILQTISTVGKLVPITLIAVFGIINGNGQILNMNSGVEGPISMGAAILATLWAYDGWMLVGFVAGEMKNPGKVLPRAIIGGISIVIVAYLAVNVAMLHVLPADNIVQLGENAAGTAATSLFGDIGGKLISVGILVSIFGCLNGKILAFPRVPFAMAERGQLPAAGLLSRVHKKLGTPVHSTILQVILAVIMMVASNPDRLSDMAIFAVYLFYVQAFYAVFILRKRKMDAGSYRVPFYPIVPIVAIVGSGYIIVSTIIDNPTDTFFAIGMALIGLPIYWFLNRNQTNHTSQEMK
ncbi:MAG TPA: amino acid permease [Bacillota bacterium]|nr:amino acid permease [Bacillota bacterium]